VSLLLLTQASMRKLQRRKRKLSRLGLRMKTQCLNAANARHAGTVASVLLARRAIRTHRRAIRTRLVRRVTQMLHAQSAAPVLSVALVLRVKSARRAPRAIATRLLKLLIRKRCWALW
jgi:hypothetical protein